jgi:hypothetical protein
VFVLLSILQITNDRPSIGDFWHRVYGLKKDVTSLIQWRRILIFIQVAFLFFLFLVIGDFFYSLAFLLVGMVAIVLFEWNARKTAH